MTTKTLSLIAVSLLLSNTIYAEETLKDITVTTANKTVQSLQETTSNITVITAEDIQEHGYQTVAEAISHVPGITLTQNGGVGQLTSLFVRGASAGRVLVLLDGMRLNDPSTPDGRATIAHLLTDNVERIEIVKGGASSIWGGNASAGVINIITKDATKGLHIISKIGYGSYDTKKAHLHASYSDDAFSGVLNASALKSDSFSALLPRDAESDPYTNKSYNIKLGYAFDANNKAKLSYNYIDYDVDYDSNFPSLNPDDILSKSTGRQKNYKFDYLFTRENMSLDFIASRGDFHREFPYGTYDVTLKEYTLLGTLAYEQGKAILGLDYKDIDDGSKGAYKNKAIYLSNTYHINASTLIETNLRYDDFDKFANKTTYKIGLKHDHDFLPGFTTGASYYTAYDAPSAFQIANPYNGASLKPAYTKGFEINANYKQYLTLSYFDNKVEDTLVYTGTYPNAGYINGTGSEHFSGIEIGSSVGYGSFVLQGNYTHLFKYEDPSGNNLSKRAKDTLNLSLDHYTDNDTHVGIDAQYIGDRQEFGQKTGNYTVWNLNFSTKLMENLNASIHAKNIFDKEYVTTAGYTTAGRSVYMDLKYSF